MERSTAILVALIAFLVALLVIGFRASRPDLVVCTDVLEHCPPEDVPWIVEELFMLARKFVFANIACYPARKYLRNGENAHCTVAPVEWWSEQIWRVAQRYANIDYRFICKEL